MKSKIFLIVLTVFVFLTVISLVHQATAITCYLDSDQDNVSAHLDDISSASLNNCTNPCSIFTDKTVCNSHSGCYYGDACAGNFNCSIFNSDPSTCNSMLDCSYGDDVIGQTCDGTVDCPAYSYDNCPTGIGCAKTQTIASTSYTGNIDCSENDINHCPSPPCEVVKTSDSGCTGGDFNDCASYQDSTTGQCTSSAPFYCDSSCYGSDCVCTLSSSFRGKQCEDLSAENCTKIDACTWTDLTYACEADTCNSTKSFQVSDLSVSDCTLLGSDYYADSSTNDVCVYDPSQCRSNTGSGSYNCNSYGDGNTCEWDSNLGICLTKNKGPDQTLSCSDHCNLDTCQNNFDTSCTESYFNQGIKNCLETHTYNYACSNPPPSVDCTSYSASSCPTDKGCKVESYDVSTCTNSLVCADNTADHCPYPCQVEEDTKGYCTGGTFDCSSFGDDVDGSCEKNPPAPAVCRTVYSGGTSGTQSRSSQLDYTSPDEPTDGGDSGLGGGESTNPDDSGSTTGTASCEPQGQDCSKIFLESNCDTAGCTWVPPTYKCADPSSCNSSKDFDVNSLSNADCNVLTDDYGETNYTWVDNKCIYDPYNCYGKSEVNCVSDCEWDDTLKECISPGGPDKTLACSNYCKLNTCQANYDMSCSDVDCSSNFNDCKTVTTTEQRCVNSTQDISCSQFDPGSCTPTGCTLNNVTVEDCHGNGICFGLDETTCNSTTGCDWGGTGSCTTIGSFKSSDNPLDCNDSNPNVKYTVNCVCDNDDDGFYPTLSDAVLKYSVCTDSPLSTTACNSVNGHNCRNAALDTVIPYWASWAGIASDTYDQDDTNPIITYLKCPAGEYFVYTKQIPVNKLSDSSLAISTQDMKDAASAGKYFGGCANDPSECVKVKVQQNVNNGNLDFCSNGWCVPAGTVWNDYNAGGNDSEIVCYDEDQAYGSNQDYEGSWADIDVQQNFATDASLNWLNAGKSAEEVGEYGTNYASPEACGDDAHEYLSTSTCEGFSEGTLCCPEPNMVAYNGTCLVDNSSCPVIQRGPPVFVSATGSLLTSFQENLEDDGFCCEGSGFIATKKDGSTYPSDSEEQSMCSDNVTGVKEEGCFVARQSLNTTVPPPSKSSCPLTSDCVFGEYTDTNLSICEVSKVCNDSLSSMTVSDSDLVCSDYTANFTLLSLQKAYLLNSSCDATAVSDCVEEDLIVCDKPVSVICDSAGSNCRYAYSESSSCRKVTTYHGPYCSISSGCAVPFSFMDYEITSVTPSSCKNVSVEKATNSTFAGLLSAGLYSRSISCSVNDYCAASSPTSTVCLSANNSLGSPVRLVDRSTSNPRELSCNDEPSQVKGDYWCPKGYEYRSYKNICYKHTSTCDQGFAGNLQHGCDALTNPSNDSLNLYDSDCVFKDAVPSGVNAYDSVCCLDSVFNGFQIWREEPDFAHVKIY